MKILITGGHLSPALSVIDYIKKKYPEIELVFIGRKYSNDFEKTLTLEYEEIKKRKIKFIHLLTGRLTWFFTLKTFLNILLVPVGILNSLIIVYREKPSCIISFGGYISLPIAFAGYVYGIPVFTHEQTINPGIANRIIGFFARRVFVAFEKTASYFSKKKVIVTGNPVRESIFKIIKKPFSIVKKHPVIYITGGSLGSHSINLHIKKILRDLLKKYIVIHQTGDSREYGDFQELLKFKKNLPTKYRRQYFLKKFFFDDEIGYIYSIADIVVTRVGANTFFELLVLRKPSVLIPLPWSSFGEQLIHAKIFEEAGVGMIFNQDEKSSRLLKLIDKLIINREKYKKNFNRLNNFYRKNATENIVKTILSAI